MTKDSKSQISKKDVASPKKGSSIKSKKSKKNEELSRNRKSHEESSDDDDSRSTEDEDDEMDVHEYRKFLSKIFPSKHLNKKIKSGEKLKKALDDEDEDEDDEEASEAEEEEKKTKRGKRVKKVSKKRSNSMKKNSKKSKTIVEESEEESEDEDEEDDDDDEDDEDDDETHEYEIGAKHGNKFNIIFTIGGVDRDDEDEDEDDWEDDDDDEDDLLEEYYENFDEDEDEDEDDEDEDEELLNKKSKKHSKKSKSKSKSTEEGGEETEAAEKSVYSNDQVLTKLKEILAVDKNNKMIEKFVGICEDTIKKENKFKEKREKKQKQKNSTKFRTIIKDKNTMNDFTFFEKMAMEDQVKIIKELEEINKITRVEKPYRLTLLEAEDIPLQFKAAAMKKLNSLRYMEPGSGEFYKIKNWVDTFMKIPFGKVNTLPITIDNGVEACHTFMEDAQKCLDSAVYGLNDAKMQIMQMMGQLITNPKAIGTAIAIQGPMGTGKTTLVKEGISKILDRPFAFIALGGATDSSFLEGHSYTYEGSVWGKIVQILIDSKCMNPVIYFDELDKISDTPKGEEIAGILTHLTDTSQNSQFHDKYFAEIDFDLSKCLFIFSYNDESKVNPILRDRMYRIQTKGYDKKQKTVISRDYLLPKIQEQVKFSAEDIIIPDEVLHYIIETHCSKEDGVRNLKRCLEIVHTKLNLYRLMRPDTNLFEEDMSIKVQFPFTVTKDVIDKLIKKNKEESWVSNLYV